MDVGSSEYCLPFYEEDSLANMRLSVYHIIFFIYTYISIITSKRVVVNHAMKYLPVFHEFGIQHIKLVRELTDVNNVFSISLRHAHAMDALKSLRLSMETSNLSYGASTVISDAQVSFVFLSFF